MVDVAPGASRSRAEVFPGPRPFQPSEAHLFFGRSREANDLYDLALSYRVLLLYSRSGAGKTSLINAALIPRLEEAGFTTLQGRVAGTVPATPTVADSPAFNVYVFNALITLLRRDVAPDTEATNTLAAHFGRAASEQAYYLVLDQFEEFFTRHPDRWDQRDGFFVQLNQALKANPNLHVLIAIREDFVANLDPYGDHLPGGFRFRYRLERLRANGAVDAITQPLKQANLRFASDDLATALVRDLCTEKLWLKDRRIDVVGEFVEPMHLQVVCRNLIANLPAGATVIGGEHVTAHARVSEALAEYYDYALTRAVAEHRGSTSWAKRLGAAIAERRGFESRLRRWIERDLITGSGTRAFAFASDATAAGIPAATINTLSRERILHVEQRAGADWVELNHDRFIDPVRTANAAWRAPRRAWALSVLAFILVVTSFAGGVWFLRQRRDIALRSAENTVQQQQVLLEEVKQERNTAAATAKGFENVLATRLDVWGAPPGRKELTPQDVDVRLEANARLEQMRVREECSAVTTAFHLPSSPHPQTTSKLLGVWRGLGFRVVEDPGGPAQLMNTVWHGKDVKPLCWRGVACTIIRAGIPVRRIAEPETDASSKSLVIEVGYSEQAQNNPPLSVSALWSLK